MISRQHLCTYLDELLRTDAIPDYCKNGLQVEGCNEIQKLATAVSASLETIEQAAIKGAQALLVHHGIFWNSDPHEIIGVKRKKLALLIQNNISLFAYHLPLDAHILYGNNWKAAMEMGWQDLMPFCHVNGVPIGVKGKVSKQSKENFQKNLENYYRHPAHCALGGKEIIETAALVSGGAYKYISQAVEEEVDCFITGSYDEPVWNQAFEENINFFALGHSATERIGPRALGEHLKEKFGVETFFIDTENPF